MQGASANKTLGEGRVLYSPDRAGRGFFRGDPTTATTLATIRPRQVETNAPENLLVELRTADSRELVVAFANLVRLGSRGLGRFTPQDVTFRCAIDVGGRAVARIILTSPGGEDETPAFVVSGGSVSFTVTIRAVVAAIVTFA